MVNGNGNGKTPTWQWIAGITMSGLMFFSSVMLLTALADIKESRVIVAKLDLRVNTIEQTMPLQFEAIKEWREEIKQSLAQIAQHQKYNADRAVERSATIIKGQEKAAHKKGGVVIFGK